MSSSAILLPEAGDALLTKVFTFLCTTEPYKKDILIPSLSSSSTSTSLPSSPSPLGPMQTNFNVQILEICRLWNAKIPISKRRLGKGDSKETRCLLVLEYMLRHGLLQLTVSPSSSSSSYTTTTTTTTRPQELCSPHKIPPMHLPIQILARFTALKEKELQDLIHASEHSLKDIFSHHDGNVHRIDEKEKKRMDFHSMNQNTTLKKNLGNAMLPCPTTTSGVLGNIRWEKRQATVAVQGGNRGNPISFQTHRDTSQHQTHPSGSSDARVSSCIDSRKSHDTNPNAKHNSTHRHVHRKNPNDTQDTQIHPKIPHDKNTVELHLSSLFLPPTTLEVKVIPTLSIHLGMQYLYDPEGCSQKATQFFYSIVSFLISKEKIMIRQKVVWEDVLMHQTLFEASCFYISIQEHEQWSTLEKEWNVPNPKNIHKKNTHTTKNTNATTNTTTSRRAKNIPTHAKTNAKTKTKDVHVQHEKDAWKTEETKGRKRKKNEHQGKNTCSSFRLEKEGEDCNILQSEEEEDEEQPEIQLNDILQLLHFEKTSFLSIFHIVQENMHAMRQLIQDKQDLDRSKQKYATVAEKKNQEFTTTQRYERMMKIYNVLLPSFDNNNNNNTRIESRQDDIHVNDGMSITSSQWHASSSVKTAVSTTTTATTTTTISTTMVNSDSKNIGNKNQMSFDTWKKRILHDSIKESKMILCQERNCLLHQVSDKDALDHAATHVLELVMM